MISKQRVSDSRRTLKSDDYVVGYTFRTKEGKVLTDGAKEWHELWKTMKEGDLITVTYVPLFPSMHWLSDPPLPVDRGLAVFEMAMASPITMWGSLKIFKRPRQQIQSKTFFPGTLQRSARYSRRRSTVTYSGQIQLGLRLLF